LIGEAFPPSQKLKSKPTELFFYFSFFSLFLVEKKVENLENLARQRATPNAKEFSLRDLVLTTN
jgi:hypothetical protein